MNESLQKVDDSLKLWSRLTKSLMMSGRSYRRRNSWGVVLYSWLLQAKPQLLGWLSLFSVSGDESPCQHLGLAGCELLLETNQITCSISLGLNRMVPSWSLVVVWSGCRILVTSCYRSMNWNWQWFLCWTPSVCLSEGSCCWQVSLMLEECEFHDYALIMLRKVILRVYFPVHRCPWEVALTGLI